LIKLVFSGVEYNAIKYEFKLIRKSHEIYEIALMSPGFFFSIMTLFYILLPRESPIRVVFSTTVVLTISMLIRNLNNFVHISSDD
jgi:hypothetical protein